MKFEVVGKQTILTVDGEDLVEGMVTEKLSESQALEFRGFLKPVDDEAKSLFWDAAQPVLHGKPTHERLGILESRKTALSEELKRVDAMIAKLKVIPEEKTTGQK